MVKNIIIVVLCVVIALLGLLLVNTNQSENIWKELYFKESRSRYEIGKVLYELVLNEDEDTYVREEEFGVVLSNDNNAVFIGTYGGMQIESIAD